MSFGPERCSAALTRLLRNPVRLQQRGGRNAVWGEEDAGLFGRRNAVWGENDDILNSGAPTLEKKFRRRTAVLASLALTGIVFFASTSVAFGDALSQKSDDLFLTRKMAGKTASGWVSLIVKTEGELTAQRKAQIASLGGYVYRHLPLIDSAAVRVPSKSVRKLAALSFVSRLSSDVEVLKNDEFTVEHSGASVAFQQYSLTGQGVTVAVLDSGIRGHSDLADPATGQSRVLANVNFVPGATDASDQAGHGTHVAGIIAGNGKASTGDRFYRTFYGIARKTNLVNVRVLDSKGAGSVSTVIKGIDWAVTNKSAYNIRVVNLSLGHVVGESYTTDPLCQAVEKAWKAGIVVVCAAGNSGRKENLALLGRDNEGYGTAYGSIQSPGNSPYVITVGAMKVGANGRASDRIATYSSRGPSRLDRVMKPDLVAPGNRIIATHANQSYLESAYSATNELKMLEYQNTTSEKESNKYFRLSGTSMAAPVVAGAAALMLQADPSLTPDTVKARLMLSADKWRLPNGQLDPTAFGAGYLNIPAALNSTAVATRSAVSPSVYREADGSVRVDSTNILWGEDDLIEDDGLWGISDVLGLNILWGEDALFSWDILSMSNILWGEDLWVDNIVWGEILSTVDLSSTAIQGEK